MQDLRPKISENFISLLEFEPWNQETLVKSARDLNLEDNYIDIIYPGKIAEFTNEFVSGCNTESLVKAWENTSTDAGIRQKMEEILYQRIKIYHDKLKSPEALKKFMAYSASPAHAAGALKNIYEFSSEAWYELGDKSTDFSYYTKRLSASVIFTKSMLYSLSDKSAYLLDTRKFIKKCIDALMKINKLKQKAKDLKSFVPDFRGFMKSPKI